MKLLLLAIVAVSVPEMNGLDASEKFDVFSSASYPQSIWRPSLMFYLLPFVILVLAVNKRISADCGLIYGHGH